VIDGRCALFTSNVTLSDVVALSVPSVKRAQACCAELSTYREMGIRCVYVRMIVRGLLDVGPGVGCASRCNLHAPLLNLCTQCAPSKMHQMQSNSCDAHPLWLVYTRDQSGASCILAPTHSLPVSAQPVPCSACKVTHQRPCAQVRTKSP
jgi:hypothetical protein